MIKSNNIIFFSGENILNILLSFIFLIISLQFFKSPLSYELFKSSNILSVCCDKKESKNEPNSFCLK